MIFLFGNPTRPTGKFQRITFGSERDRWLRHPVDSRKAKFTNKQQIAEWIADYGEDSDFVRVRVRGECPRATADQLIPFDVVAACRKFQAVGYQNLPKILACDPARFGDCRSVLGLRQGRHFRILTKLRGADTVEVAHRVIAAIESEKPDAVVIDGDGLGAGVVDQLRHRGFGTGLHEFHGGQRAFDADAWFNRRAECWGLMAAWLKAGAQIPDDPELAADLTSPLYGYSNKSQIQLERKEDLRSRGLASPDSADTLAYTFAVKVAPRSQPDQPRAEWYNATDASLAWMS